MLARLSAFVIWAVVAASVVFWGMRLLVRAPSAPSYVVPVGDASAVRGDLSKLLGSAPVASVGPVAVSDANSRFRLLGIMAPKGAAQPTAGHGVALIAVDGKMPRAFEVGSRLDGELVLQSVSLRTASIGSEQGGAPVVTLELPPPTAAATGKLPMGGASTSTPPTPPPAAAQLPVPPQVPPAPPQVMPAPPGVPSQGQPQINPQVQ